MIIKREILKYAGNACGNTQLTFYEEFRNIKKINIDERILEIILINNFLFYKTSLYIKKLRDIKLFLHWYNSKFIEYNIFIGFCRNDIIDSISVVKWELP